MFQWSELNIVRVVTAMIYASLGPLELVQGSWAIIQGR